MKPVLIRISKFGSVRRYDGDGKTIANGGTRVHAARDVYFPKDSALYTPAFPTTFKRWGISNSDKTLTAGRVCYLEARGLVIRLLHVAAEGYAAKLKLNEVLPGHNPVGRSMPGKFPGGSDSHLHLDGWPIGTGRDERVDMLERLGFAGVLALGGYMLAQEAPPISACEFKVLAVPLLEAPFIEAA